MAQINHSRRIRLQTRARELLNEGNDETTVAHIMVADQLCSEPIARKIVGWAIANDKTATQATHEQVKKDGLTKRQNEIARYLAQGLTKPQIAQKLAGNLRMANMCCRSISKKWGIQAEDIAALQAEAQQRGYHLDEPTGG